MALADEAAAIVVNQSRGIEPQQALITLKSNYGWNATPDAAIQAAKYRQLAVVYGLKQAGSQAATLATQIEAARTSAAALKTTLEAVKATAETDLDNPTAGDASIAALATLLAALDTAATAIRAIPNLFYTSYRDA